MIERLTAADLAPREAYFKAPAAMASVFRRHRAALANTRRIAESCTFTLERKRWIFPDPPLPAGETAASHLRALCEAGFMRRYGARTAAPAAGREATRSRTRHHRAPRVLVLLRGGGGDRALRARARRGHGGARERSECGHRLRARHHQRRSHPLRPRLRALPPREAPRLARSRRRSLLEAPRRGDRACLRRLRSRSRGHDLDPQHLWHALGVPRSGQGARRRQPHRGSPEPLRAARRRGPAARSPRPRRPRRRDPARRAAVAAGARSGGATRGASRATSVFTPAGS